jgi:hypothetical protein
MQLTIVGTVHAETGLANSNELLKILERLKPDVIFAEIPPSYVGRYCDGSHGTLEAVAVARYKEGHQFAVIPVDLEKPEEAFFSDAREMFDKVERTSHDYRRLMDQHSRNTRTDGFPYLNSDRCIQAWTDIRSEVLATLDWIGNPQLQEVYSKWRMHDERRDVEMVARIADYADRKGLGHGVFLFGAAHMQSILEKTRGFAPPARAGYFKR